MTTVTGNLGSTTHGGPDRLPYGVGKITTGWAAFVGVNVVVIAIGLSALYRVLTQGLVVTGMRDVGTMGGAAWGLYIGFDVFFVGVSFAGISIAALIRLMNLEKLKPVARMAELLTVVALILSVFTILIDLGQPLRGIVNLFRYARPQSPFFGTFSLVISGYLSASLVFLYLDSRRDAALCARVPGRLQGLHRFLAAGYKGTAAEERRHARVGFWLSVAILPLLVVAHSTLGFVFGLQAGRPGWFSALQAPGFVVLAGISGVGLLLVLAATIRRALGDEGGGRLHQDVFAWLGRFMMVLILVYLYFMIVEMLTNTYAGQGREADVTKAIVTGRYSWVYWLSVASLVVPLAVLLWQARTRRWRIGWLVACGAVVNIAAVAKRFLVVVPSQTHGTLLPYQTGSYSPRFSEIAFIVGLFALGAFLISVFMKLFPIMETEGEAAEGARDDA